MFTNKEFCEAYLAFQYNTQFVDLQRTSRIHVDAILNSPLLPGRYVKTLYLQNFKAIDDLDGIDRATDSLYRIMERSPNVQKVSFTPSRENAAKDWCYFLRVLLKNWKI